MAISRQDFCSSGPSVPPPDYAWFHGVLTTYGAWLPGDPRGFRTRRHREHVEGDYRNPPPPGKYAARHAHAQRLLKQAAVKISEPMRPVVGQALAERLSGLGGYVMAVAAAGRHCHVLVKMPPSKTRDWFGAAKRHVWFELRNQFRIRKFWAKRGKFTPVHDPEHLRNALRYILAHKEQGAWIWARPDLSETLMAQLCKK